MKIKTNSQPILTTIAKVIKKTHTQPKDQQFPIILKMYTNIQPIPTITAKDSNPNTVAELAQLIYTVTKQLDEDTVEYIYGMLSEDPFDDDTRETVCGIFNGSIVVTA